MAPPWGPSALVVAVVALAAVGQCAPAPPPAYTFRVDPGNSTHTVAQEFVSFTLDLQRAHHGFRNINFTDPVFLATARTFAPTFLRLGGTAEDNMTYLMGDASNDALAQQQQRCRGLGGRGPIPALNLTAAEFDELSRLAAAAGWSICFGLNTYRRWRESATHAWDPSNAAQLIRHAIQHGAPVVGWELGNEVDLNNKGGAIMTPAINALHFQQLRTLMQSLYGPGPGNGSTARPWLMGPDVTHNGVAHGFLAAFLGNVTAESAPEVVTWHHYYVAGAGSLVNASDFLEPAFLNGYVTVAEETAAVVAEYRAATGRNPQLWMGETSGAGGATAGSQNVIGKFLGVFWYADKLGVAAATGHRVVCRQQYPYMVASNPGGGVTVTPEFWLTQLWRRTMGTHVLAVTGDRLGPVRVYAHAAEAPAAGTVSVVVINLNREAVPVTIDLGPAYHGPHDEYRLTAFPDATNMNSTGAALNGNELKLRADGSLPALPAISAPGSVVNAAPLSVTFAVFKA